MNRTHPIALATVTAIAETLSDPHPPPAVTADGRARPQSLAGGALGIALLHIERARSGYGDDVTAHTWLKLATSVATSAGLNANLFHGAPALGLALHAATADTRRYSRALAALDDKTIAITRRRLAAAHDRMDRGDRLQMREFDLVHGLTGLGVYHLQRHPDRDVTRDVLGYLVRLTQPLPGGQGVLDALPPWWMPVGLSGEPSSEHPHGHGNFGIAHGIGAVLALLSLAVIRDLAVTGARDAIARLCAWTDQWRQHGESGPWWPGYLTFDQARHLVQPDRPRPSWCYGVSGTARAQQLAGMALKDGERQRAAVDALLAALRDPAQRALLPDIGLCHGKAGLLQSAWRMAIDAGSSELAAELPDLVAQLAAQLDQPNRDPELMDGAAGAALALHAFGTGSVPASHWDAFFLLA